MLWLPETIDRGVDTACGDNCHTLCRWFFLIAQVRSGLVIIMWASGFRMGVARISKALPRLAVQGMREAGLDTLQHVESLWILPQRGGVLRLLVPSMAVGVISHCLCVADRVEVAHWVISEKWELFSEDKRLELWPCIVEGTELLPWEECFSLASRETRLLGAGSS